MSLYLLLFIPPLILGAIGQMWLKRTFETASKMRASSGLTGAQVARRLLDSGGLNVGIEAIGGSLSDHYDPRGKVMRLSQPVGNSDSIAAVAVAAHETGHAFQDARHESLFTLRGSLAPAVGFASQAWFPLVMLGLFTSAGGSGSSTLLLLGAAVFAVTVLFQLVTLPVEFGASRRAMQMLTAQGILTPDEAPMARKVLTAAALTYVIGTLIAIYQLLILLAQSRN
jgi:Zn-dependent membrane protease YugP